MQLSENIEFKNFQLKKNLKQLKIIKHKLLKLLLEKNMVLKSLGKSYKNDFDVSKIKKYKNLFNFRIIGMGGSVLGSQAIYDFLKHKIKKNFIFIDNLKYEKKIDKKKYFNLVISKSGNTIETIVNANLLIKKK